MDQLHYPMMPPHILGHVSEILKGDVRDMSEQDAEKLVATFMKLAGMKVPVTRAEVQKLIDDGDISKHNCEVMTNTLSVCQKNNNIIIIICAHAFVSDRCMCDSRC